MGVGAGGLCRPAACPSCRAWSLLSSFPRASLRRGSPPALPLLPKGRRGERLPLKGQAFLSACAYRCPDNRFAAVTSPERGITAALFRQMCLHFVSPHLATRSPCVTSLRLRDSRFTKSGVRHSLRINGKDTSLSFRLYFVTDGLVYLLALTNAHSPNF